MNQICRKSVFPIKNRKSEHEHWILHIWISLNIKFHFELTILFFWTKFAEKAYSPLKTEKVNMNIEFCIFKLVYNHGHNILELYNVLIQTRWTTSKTKHDISSKANLVYELPNNLRLRILGNKEILGKSQIWVET